MILSRPWNLGDYLDTIRIRPSGKDSDTEECVLPGNNHPEVMNWVSNSRIEFV